MDLLKYIFGLTRSPKGNKITPAQKTALLAIASQGGELSASIPELQKICLLDNPKSASRLLSQMQTEDLIINRRIRDKANGQISGLTLTLHPVLLGNLYVTLQNPDNSNSVNNLIECDVSLGNLYVTLQNLLGNIQVTLQNPHNFSNPNSLPEIDKSLGNIQVTLQSLLGNIQVTLQSLGNLYVTLQKSPQVLETERLKEVSKIGTELATRAGASPPPSYNNSLEEVNKTREGGLSLYNAGAGEETNGAGNSEKSEKPKRPEKVQNANKAPVIVSKQAANTSAAAQPEKTATGEAKGQSALDSPAVLVWFEATGEDAITSAGAEMIANQVFNLKVWRETLRGWLASGWAASNIDGQVSRFLKKVREDKTGNSPVLLNKPPADAQTEEQKQEKEKLKNLIYGGEK